MPPRSVCLVGGSGFVGRAVAEHLASRGMAVRVITRSSPRARRLTVLPTLELFVGNPHDPAILERAFQGMDAVVNLVGILNETRRQSFAACHVELPAKIVAACRARGVGHLVHMSALGASAEGPSRYQRSKAEGEARVKAGAGPMPVSILRPSVIFGADGGFLKMFTTLVRWFPVIPLAGADARVQPIWVEDVARCVGAILAQPGRFGDTYELGGPDVLTLREVVDEIARCLGRHPLVVPLRGPLAVLQATALEMLPGKLMTRDNLRSLGVDNVCSRPFPEAFGFRPARFATVVPGFLAGEDARARYPEYRDRAGR